MKLTLVTETFPPEINGVSMTLGRLTEGMAARGVEVDVVCPGRRNRIPESFLPRRLVQVRGIPIPRYPELRFGLPAIQRLKRKWAGKRPDFVHIATEGPLGWSALHAANALDIPVVTSYHTNFHSYGRHYGYGFLQPLVLNWLRYLHNRSLCTFVPSTDLIEQLRRSGFERLSLLARGVDTRLFDPERRDSSLRRSWDAEESTPVALYVGRLAREKNLDLVIRAWRRMQESLPDLRLVLVGDGPERRKLSEAIPEIRFAGVQEGVALASHYASADCFLFASQTETFGNVVTEAMASGLPVLAFDYAAPGRFIHQSQSGYVVPLGDEAAYLDFSSRMASRRSDWVDMGRLARDRILPHSWDAVINHYLEEVNRVLPSGIARSA